MFISTYKEEEEEINSMLRFLRKRVSDTRNQIIKRKTNKTTKKIIHNLVREWYVHNCVLRSITLVNYLSKSN